MNRILVVLSFSAAAAAAAAAQDPVDARVHTVAVRGHVHMLVGRGGNVGVSVGEDGAFLIDDQFAPMVGQLRAAVEKLTDRPIRFVINTHWHGDHTGGNERFGKAGALIFAHENVRERMSVEQFMAAFDRRVPPAPAAALPVVTFTRDVTLHWNGDDVRLFHVPHAHTDGDAIVWFEKADVVHMGDCLFTDRYPFIDAGSGGTLHGLIAAVDRVLEIADADTRIIPGHGSLTDRAGLAAYREMLAGIRARLVDALRAGQSADEIVAAAPTAPWDEDRGGPDERWLRAAIDIVRQELAAEKAEKEPAPDRDGRR